jgi:hypothetical protein
MTEAYDWHGTYEARFGFNGADSLRLLGCIGFVLVSVLVPMPMWARVLTAGFFGLAFIFAGLTMLSRRVALRVDQAGVTLGGGLRSSGTAFAPWEDIQAIIVWPYLYRGRRSIPYIGLSRREGLPALPGGPSQLGRAMLIAQSAVPENVVLASRPVRGWTLDVDRLGTAVHEFAPDIEVTDLRGSGSPHK